ncbi:hypothetical protein EVD20_05695 [Elizabethkingia bruuniana]|nr:hypothetical protein [Elizabethkingia bruuniana]QDZ62401.1 hypothetical protein EVD20_05695 [Elizabethkingia bruuniana]
MRKILFLLILYSFSISAQYSKEKEINYALDTIRINKVPFYVKNETDKKLALVENLYLQSKEIGYTTGQVNALLYMAATYCIRGDIDNTIVKCDEGLSLTKGKEKYALQRVNFYWQKVLFLFRWAISKNQEKIFRQHRQL